MTANFSDKRTAQRGFTLAEILVVIAVVGLLSSVIFAIVSGSGEQGRIAKGLYFSQHLQNSLGSYVAGIWNFDEGSGSTVNDTSGWGNNGTVYGAAYADDTPSARGYALLLDGQSNYAAVNYGAGNKPSELKLTKFTVAAWVKANSLPSNNVYVVTDREGCGRTNYLLNITNGYPRIDFIVDGSSPHEWRSAQSSERMQTGVWHYLTGTYDSQDLKIYLNGAMRGVRPSTTDTPEDDDNSAMLKFGYSSCIHSSVSNYFDGFIDEVRIYGTALTSAQIRSQYYAGLGRLLSQDQITEQEYWQGLAMH